MTEEQLRAEISKKQQKLAKISEDIVGEAEKSIDHCTLQCEFWRLMFAMSVLTISNAESDKARILARPMLEMSSREGERWENRRQAALKYRKADDLAACRKMMEELLGQGAQFDELDD